MIGKCPNCQKMTVLIQSPPGATVCAECSAPPYRGRKTQCNFSTCSEPIHSHFFVDILMDDLDTADSEIVGEAVNRIIRGIIYSQGGLCQKHLSESFDSICQREDGNPSGFDRIYRDIMQDNAKERDERFREEWI